MTIKAYAKINLYLDIIGRLDNGYHIIESVMQQISLYDEISLELCEKGNIIELRCDNPQIPDDESNIAWRAAKAFFSRIKKSASIRIDIKKNIPCEGGLGGSSTDGAAVLHCLNEYYRQPFAPEELYRIADTIGSDVAFCLAGGAALCTGTGSEITPIVTAKDCVFLLVKPQFGLNTSRAYGLYDQNPIAQKGETDKLIKAMNNNEFYQNSGLLYNVFEHIYNDGRIDEIKTELINSGAKNALLTGSGSTVFGVFRNEEQAHGAIEKIKEPQKFIAFPI